MIPSKFRSMSRPGNGILASLLTTCLIYANTTTPISQNQCVPKGLFLGSIRQIVSCFMKLLKIGVRPGKRVPPLEVIWHILEMVLRMILLTVSTLLLEVEI